MRRSTSPIPLLIEKGRKKTESSSIKCLRDTTEKLLAKKSSGYRISLVPCDFTGWGSVLFFQTSLQYTDFLECPSFLG